MVRSTSLCALLFAAALCTARAAGVADALAAPAPEMEADIAQGGPEPGVGSPEWFVSAVGGRLHDAADPLFLWAPVLENATEFKAAQCSGAGFCFPHWASPDYVWPKVGCEAGYQLNKMGKCVLRAYRKVDACFFGPLCAAPFNGTGEQHCLDDKAMEVVVGLLALKKHGGALPTGLSPALAEFGDAALSAPLALSRDSLAGHVVAAAGMAKLAGGASAALGEGQQALDLLDLGTKLMSINWRALPDFPELHAHVVASAEAVPRPTLDALKAVTPRCMRHCCKEEVQVDKDFQTPMIACPENYKFDIVTLKCVAEGMPAGYAACPAGMQRCRVSSWRRPLCAAANMITGVDSCELFEGLALAHKLPKLACPVH